MRRRRDWNYDEPRPSIPEPRPHLLKIALDFVRDARKLDGVHRIALVGSLATTKPIPKDADLLVTIDRDLDLEPLARIGRRLKGNAQKINLGADIFLADESGQYLGRICSYRECFPRMACQALNCTLRAHLNDDLENVTLREDVVRLPPAELWPRVARRGRLPSDVETYLLRPLEAEQTQGGGDSSSAPDRPSVIHPQSRPAAPMLRVSAFAISLDGYGAGPRQDLDNPLGVGGEALHNWMFGTRTFQRMLGQDGGSTGIDNGFAERSMAGVGAWIMGRNMFGPIRGPWPDESWKGWWGDTPPYHCSVFVLTHHPRASLTMAGGTTFHFVTDGIHAALERAREAAGARDVRIGGGVETVRQYLRAGLVDEMHLVLSPVLLGSGEHLLQGLDLNAQGFSCTENVASPEATHVVLTRRNP